MNLRNICLLVAVICVSGVFLFGCGSSPDKIVSGTITTGGEVAKGVVDGTGTVVREVADGTGKVVAAVTGDTGRVVHGAANTAGGAVENVTVGATESADDFGQTVTGIGQEMGKKRNVDVFGQDVEVNLEKDKKIRMEF
ncbi:MAG: hypothetical protein P9M13_10000 [Candidatus Ancaeobacter aquaticus]|nr:hypothetical protein [Candidatus Ancaeobacter aquaticus]